MHSGKKVAIYTFPPAGLDRHDSPGEWPYPYPPYPHPHPAFPPVPVYPAFGAPAPYVPLGSGLPTPPMEVRGIDLKPGGRLVLEISPEDAEVYVDGTRLTARSDRGYDVGLLAGRHRIDVRRPGFSPWGQEVEVPPGGGLLVKVELDGVPVPPASKAAGK